MARGLLGGQILKFLGIDHRQVVAVTTDRFAKAARDCTLVLPELRRTFQAFEQIQNRRAPSLAPTTMSSST
jgi:hypothetical protein